MWIIQYSSDEKIFHKLLLYILKKLKKTEQSSQAKKKRENQNGNKKSKKKKLESTKNINKKKKTTFEDRHRFHSFIRSVGRSDTPSPYVWWKTSTSTTRPQLFIDHYYLCFDHHNKSYLIIKLDNSNAISCEVSYI